MDTTRDKEPSTRIVYLLIGMACVFIIIWGIRSSAFILNPILLAAVITITVLPLPERLMRRGWKGWTSLIVTILAVFGVLALVAFTVTYSITNLAAQIPTYEASIAERQSIEAASQEENPSILSQWELTLSPDQLDTLVAGLASQIGQSVFLIFITMMIFGFMLSAAITTPQLREVDTIQESSPMRRVSTLTREVRHYISIMTVVNFLVGLGDAVFLWFIGVDFAVLWGIIAWFLGYIPTVGFWVALIPPVILAWAQFGPDQALIVFLGYVLINGSVQNIIQPKLMGQGLKISPVVVFICVFFWGWVLGGLGAILAVPLTLLVLEILDSFESTRWLVVLLRAGPERKQGEQKAAAERVKDIWEKIKGNGRGEKELRPVHPEVVEHVMDRKEVD